MASCTFCIGVQHSMAIRSVQLTQIPTANSLEGGQTIRLSNMQEIFSDPSSDGLDLPVKLLEAQCDLLRLDCRCRSIIDTVQGRFDLGPDSCLLLFSQSVSTSPMAPHSAVQRSAGQEVAE